MRVILLLAALLSGACAGANSGGTNAVPAGDALARRDDQARMVPPGYGTLRQDEVTVSIRSGSVLVKVTPLDEATIRLLAPDTYTRLHAVRESRRTEAARGMMQLPELFLVSFFSYQPDMTFQPEDVQLVYQSRLMRAQGIVPITGGWGQQRLGQQETQSAIYAFEGPINYDQVITVRYGMEQSDEWRQILTRLENERSRVLSRIK